MNTDILVIGSGPAGLSAAIYGLRGNASVLVVEKEFMGTGQIAEGKQIDNYIGMVGMEGFAMGEKFREDAEKSGVSIVEETVVSIEKSGEEFITTLENEEQIVSKTIIYAAGATHRHLGIAEEQKFSGKGISYCAVCDGAFYKNKVVAVIGGGDTALDDARYLAELCEKVYLVHRREEFRGSAKTLEQLKKKENVEIITNANVTSILGEKKVETVVLNGEKQLPVDGIFVSVGMEPQTKLLSGLLELEQGYVPADETGVTTLPGLFVAGDVRVKKLRQVVTAVADGANAATSALEYLK